MAAKRDTAPKPEGYILATGEGAALRLRLLNDIFGPGTREVLTRAGLRQGWHTADFGSGTGLVALWMAKKVGRSGSVTCVDSSGEQLKVAQRNFTSAGVENVVLHEASAYDTGLPSNSFDLIYSRFLLCHLTRPLDALMEMRALLKPNGVLVCEDFEASTITTDPPTAAYARLVEISRAVDYKRGLDSEIGLKLHRLFRQVGFQWPEVSLKQVAHLRGEAKRFWALTLLEATPSIIESGAATANELESICAEMEAIARDDTTLVVTARVSQVWACK
jgi:ubiquinone/menaquinone biosynthesis C-methylase UbiE